MTRVWARRWGGLCALCVLGCQGQSTALPSASLLDAGVCAPAADAGSTSASADVLTGHNDTARTGATLAETALDNCSVPALASLGSYPIDGEVYAQPLYASAVATASGSKNLLLVATMEDSLYAFDADRPGSDPLWRLGAQHELGTAALSVRNVGGNNGILATPVIDRATETLFLLARDCDPAFPARAPSCTQRVFAISLKSGEILQTIAVSGNATDSAGHLVPFDPSLHWGRAALLLQHGTLFVTFGSGPNGAAHEEDFLFHGWVFGFSANDLTQAPSVYCSTPDFGGGAIWQSGDGPAADDDALYFATGNGIHQPTPLAPNGFPERPEGDEDCVVRLPLAEPSRGSHFWDQRPYHADGNVFQYMEKNDIDFATAGPLLIPGTSRLISAGKAGILYVLERASLELSQDPLPAFSAPALAAGQTLYIYSYDAGPHVHGAPVFFRPAAVEGGSDQGLIFLWPEYDRLKSFAYDYQTGLVTERAAAAVPALPSGGMLSVSADGARADSAVVWASAVDADGVSGHLWAFSATTLTRLWDAKLPAWSKFAVPTIAAGRVYLASTSNTGTSQSIQVFGLH